MDRVCIISIPTWVYEAVQNRQIISRKNMKMRSSTEGWKMNIYQKTLQHQIEFFEDNGNTPRKLFKAWQAEPVHYGNAWPVCALPCNEGLNSAPPTDCCPSLSWRSDSILSILWNWWSRKDYLGWTPHVDQKVYYKGYIFYCFSLVFIVFEEVLVRRVVEGDSLIVLVCEAFRDFIFISKCSFQTFSSVMTKFHLQYLFWWS